MHAQLARGGKGGKGGSGAGGALCSPQLFSECGIPDAQQVLLLYFLGLQGHCGG